MEMEKRATENARDLANREKEWMTKTNERESMLRLEMEECLKLKEAHWKNELDAKECALKRKLTAEIERIQNTLNVQLLEQERQIRDEVAREITEKESQWQERLAVLEVENSDQGVRCSVQDRTSNTQPVAVQEIEAQPHDEVMGDHEEPPVLTQFLPSGKRCSIEISQGGNDDSLMTISDIAAANAEKRSKITSDRERRGPGWKDIDIGYRHSEASEKRFPGEALQASKLPEALKQMITDEDMELEHGKESVQENTPSAKTCWLSQRYPLPNFQATSPTGSACCSMCEYRREKGDV